MDVSPPTDDRPFYLFFMRLKDVLQLGGAHYEGEMSSISAIRVLAFTLTTLTVLTILCVFCPLMLSKTKPRWKNAAPLLFFFSSIGLGYMFIEISQMQRLSIFLGHPVYGLSVVLFTFLLSSGVGSYFSSRFPDTADGARQLKVLCTLVITLLVFGLITPELARSFESANLAIRILVALAILAPPGFIMGMAFPIGMTVAQKTSNDLTPWLWGINGTASVYASILVMAVALTFGIAAAFWTETACYAVAAASYAWAMRTVQQ
jgi:hypothetical protein